MSKQQESEENDEQKEGKDLGQIPAKSGPTYQIPNEERLKEITNELNTLMDAKFEILKSISEKTVKDLGYGKIPVLKQSIVFALAAAANYHRSNEKESADNETAGFYTPLADLYVFLDELSPLVDEIETTQTLERRLEDERHGE